MGNRITVPEDQWTSLLRRVDRIEIQQKSDDSVKHSIATLEQTGPSENEKKVLEYIRQYRGVNTEAVVKYFRNEISRNTVYKIIKNLKRNGLIKITDSPENRHTNSITLNNDDKFNSILLDLYNFESAFSNLVDAFHDKIYSRGLGSVIQNKSYLYDEDISQDSSMEEAYTVLIKLAHIFFQVSKIYTINCYFMWPAILVEKEVVSRLYMIILSTMQRIQTKLFESNPVEYDRNLALMKLLIADNSSLGIPYFRNLLQFFSSNDLKKEFEPVMNFLWKFGFDLIDKSHSLKIKTNERDWQAILAP